MSKETSRSDSSAAPVTRPKRRFLAGLLTGSILGGALAMGANVFANSPDGHGWVRAHCSARGHHGAMDPEAMRERMEFGVDRMLSKLKATDAQKTQVKAIMETSFNEMLALREQHTANRDAIVASLTGDVVDRDKLEAARKAEVALAERASLLMSKSAADVAEVLTPEQRRGFLEAMRRFGVPMGFPPGMTEQPKRS